MVTFRHSTLCTGGSDGVVMAWNPTSKKRLRVFPKHPAGVASLAFNRDGKYLAIASSYCYEEGEKEYALTCALFANWSLVTLPIQFSFAPWKIQNYVANYKYTLKQLYHEIYHINYDMQL